MGADVPRRAVGRKASDRRGSGRRHDAVNALTRRIVLSVGLVLAIIFAAWMGWIDFHGVGSNPGR